MWGRAGLRLLKTSSKHELSPLILSSSRLSDEDLKLIILAFATEADVNLSQRRQLEQIVVLRWQKTLSCDVKEFFEGWGRSNCTHVFQAFHIV